MGIIKSRRKNIRGFTLVELTVSMGILALIVGLTAGVLISVVKSYQRQKVLNEIERNGDFIIRTLEESLRGANSIECTELDGTTKIATDGSGVTTCDLGTNYLLPGRLLVVNRSDSTKYFGRGMDDSASCNDTSTTSSCYAYVVNTINDIDGSGGLIDEAKITDDSSANGVHVDQFRVLISGGGASSAPYNITVTIVIKGPVKSSLWAEESRTFQSFLTLRGSY